MLIALKQNAKRNTHKKIDVIYRLFVRDWKKSWLNNEPQSGRYEETSKILNYCLVKSKEQQVGGIKTVFSIRNWLIRVAHYSLHGYTFIFWRRKAFEIFVFKYLKHNVRSQKDIEVHICDLRLIWVDGKFKYTLFTFNMAQCIGRWNVMIPEIQTASKDTHVFNAFFHIK